MDSAAWDKAYKNGEFLDRPIHSEMPSITRLFKKEKVKRILDLGCGTGRHTVYLASQGYDVYGLDSSQYGLSHTKQTLQKMNLSANLLLHDMKALPYDDNYFDAVIAIQTIHHNKLKDIKRSIQEIHRVLKKQGLAWITMPVSKNEPSTNQTEIEPGTFIPLNGREKGLPHHYFTRLDIKKLFSDFVTVDLHVDSTNHYSLLLGKKLACLKNSN